MATARFVLHRIGRSSEAFGAEWGYRFEPVVDRFPLDGLRHTRRSDSEVLRDRLGVEEHRVRHDSVDDLLGACRHGGPTIVPCDAFHLAHSTCHRRLHLAHRVVVLAVEEDRVLVVDPLGHTPFAGWADRPTFAAAAAGVGEAVGGEGGGLLAIRLRPTGVEPAATADDDLADSVRYHQQVGGPVVARVVAGLRSPPWSDGAEPLELASTLAAMNLCSSVASQRAEVARTLAHHGRAGDRPDLLASAELAAAAGAQWSAVQRTTYLRAREGAATASRRLATAIERLVDLDYHWNARLGSALG